MSLKVIAVTIALATGAATAGLASAATLPVAQSTPAASSYVQDVAFGRCIGWRNTCAARWGWGTWRFRRCMRLHAC